MHFLVVDKTTRKIVKKREFQFVYLWKRSRSLEVSVHWPYNARHLWLPSVITYNKLAMQGDHFKVDMPNYKACIMQIVSFFSFQYNFAAKICQIKSCNYYCADADKTKHFNLRQGIFH